MPTHETASYDEDGVPLAVWPCRQPAAQHHPPTSGREHPDAMVPELARRIVATFTGAEALVVAPMAGAGATLMEAARLGRYCIGVESQPGRVELTERAVHAVLTPDQRRLVDMRRGEAGEVGAVVADVAGRMDLVTTLLPPEAALGTDSIPAASGRGDLPDQHDQGALAAMVGEWFTVLRPGGFCVIVVRPTHRHGQLAGSAGTVVAQARAAGFVYLQHIIALHAEIRDSSLIARPSLRQILTFYRARSRGLPQHLPVHHDVLVLRKLTETPSRRQEAGDE